MISNLEKVGVVVFVIAAGGFILIQLKISADFQKMLEAQQGFSEVLLQEGGIREMKTSMGDILSKISSSQKHLGPLTIVRSLCWVGMGVGIIIVLIGAANRMQKNRKPHSV